MMTYDTGGNSEESDVPGEMEIDFDDDIGRMVMADTVINEEGKSMSGIEELVLGADINGETHIGCEIVPIEECDLDKNENQNFMGSGCGCTVNKGKPCFDQFNEIHYTTMHKHCAKLDHNSLDIVITCQIMAIPTYQNS